MLATLNTSIHALGDFMVMSHRWRSNAALFMALGMASTAALPTLLAAPALARTQPYVVSQLFPNTTQTVRVPAGSLIPVRYDEAERIILKPDETVPVTLIVAADIRSTAGTVLIPVGSQVEGELRPVSGGTQFVADELILPSGQRRSIDATSDPITDTEIITEETSPDILRGAAIGAAAGAVLAEIFGSIDIGEVLLGAGLGAIASWIIGGNDREVEVIVVEPATDLDLTLGSDFVL